MGLPRDDPNEVYHLNVGEAAFFDDCVEILPNAMDSGMYHNAGDNISAVLSIYQDRLEQELKDKVGGKIITETDDQIDVSRHVNGIAYALRCGKPSTDTMLKQKARKALGKRDIDSWVWAAYHYPNRIYVGGTHRPDERMEEHLGISYEYEGSIFTDIFPPQKIETIILSLDGSPYELEREEARFWEEDGIDDVFVFQS